MIPQSVSGLHRVDQRIGRPSHRPARVQDIVGFAEAPRDWSRKNIEVVLETDVIQGRSSPPRVSAVYVWWPASFQPITSTITVEHAFPGHNGLAFSITAVVKYGAANPCEAKEAPGAGNSEASGWRVHHVLG